MPTQTRSPLKGLTEKQLKAVEVILKYDLTLDLQRSHRYKMTRPFNVTLGPGPNTSAGLEEIRRIYGVRFFGNMSNYLERLGAALFKKGLLVEIAEVWPEVTNDTYHGTRPRKARYALNNAVREAAGGIAVALGEMAAKEQAAVARQVAWDEARRPLDAQAHVLKSRGWKVRSNLRDLLEEPTPDALLAAHAEQQQIRSELNELNALLKSLADVHGRSWEPYTL